MNISTKKSLIFSLLAIAIIAVGVVVFCIAGESIYDNYSSDNANPEHPFAGLFNAIAGAIALYFVAVFDIIFTSLFVYTFAYFSHENALAAITEANEAGASLKLPKFLRVLSVVEMILAAVASLAAILSFLAIFAFA